MELEYYAKKIVTGYFNGQGMQGDDDVTYPVPGNYASKSRLIQGDKLKLIIMDDGRYIYKQIMPARRKRVMGKILVEIDSFGRENFTALVGEKIYNLLPNSATYYQLYEGQEVSLIIPAEGYPTWAAIDVAIRILKNIDQEMSA